MNTPAPKRKYLFIDPNTPGEFAEGIRKILMERLAALHQEHPSETA